MLCPICKGKTQSTRTMELGGQEDTEEESQVLCSYFVTTKPAPMTGVLDSNIKLS